MCKIAIILAYYDGQIYLKELLDSIFSQTHQDFHIFLFDDNSPKDINLESLNISNKNKKKITIYKRKENLGFANNFLDAVLKIDSFFEFYSFCDQDDIWISDKLERGIKRIKKESSDIPLIYGTKTLHINETGERIIGESINIPRALSFKNALLQSFAGGNTMIFNYKAKEIIASSVKTINPISHDWWSYLIVSGCGGKIIYDNNYSLLYRQHNKNLMGSNKLFKGKIKRILKLFNSTFKRYIDLNLNGLFINYEMLTPENKKILERFAKARNYNFFRKVFFYLNSGIYRQNFLGNLLFFILFVIGRI